MIASSCSTVACSASDELRNGTDWYGQFVTFRKERQENIV
jgi:hypothetical protein